MDELETAEEFLFKQQRKEKKDLQARIQSMKNAVPKNDKKRRKQLAEDIAKLEAELNQKHEEELKQLNSSVLGDKADVLANGVDTLALDSEDSKLSKQRTSKAQKRRDKKAALEKERENRIAEAEVENLLGTRHLENQKLSQILSEKQLQIKEILSDGHCLYRAVEDQLRQRGLTLGLLELRAQTAQHMRKYAEDFIPFLTNPTTGDIYSMEEFERYCSEVADTAAWGGQLELRALTQVLRIPIEVIQADSPMIVIGEEYHEPPITLVYMRHAYGLGEHYNSVEPLTETAAEEQT